MGAKTQGKARSRNEEGKGNGAKGGVESRGESELLEHYCTTDQSARPSAPPTFGYRGERPRTTILSGGNGYDTRQQRQVRVQRQILILCARTASIKNT